MDFDFGEHKGCHRKWETVRKIELLDYKKNMNYIRSISAKLFDRLKNNAESFIVK